MKMCKNKWVFAHRIPPGLPKSSQLRFKILSFTFKFQTDNSKIQILFSIFKIPTSRALASKVQGFSIQGFSIQGFRIQGFSIQGFRALASRALASRALVSKALASKALASKALASKGSKGSSGWGALAPQSSV